MKRQNLLFFSLPLVFLLGFLCGSYWQAMLDRPTPAPPTGDAVKAPAAVPVTAPTTEEEKLARALEDPDFKRVHDFLSRETPMQMNLDLPSSDAKEDATEKPVPFSERPFQFETPK